MKVTKTIKLSEEEVRAISHALNIIDEISNVCVKALDEVFYYICDKSNIGEDKKLMFITDVIQIDEV